MILMEAATQLPESVMIFGCGYVGTALAQKLLSKGVRVGALTRNQEKADVLRSMGLSEVVVANLQEHDWHSELAGQYEGVVNCVSSAGGGIEGYRQSYLGGQASILKWATTQELSSYVYTSSTSVYPQDGGVEVDEAADTSNAPATGQVILESEELIANAVDILGRWYVLRLAGIYGPQRHYLLNLLKEGQAVIPGSGDYALNVIHLEDIVTAICAALSSKAPSGIYNVADDAPASKAEMVDWLAAELGCETPRFDPEHVSPRLARRGGRMPDRRILNGKARSLLAWAPKYSSFREGYRDLL